MHASTSASGSSRAAAIRARCFALILGMNVALMVGAIVLSLFALFVLWLVGAY